MSWLKANRRVAWVVGVTLLLPLMLYLNALFGLLQMRFSYQSQVERLEPRIARLQGVMNFEEQLAESAVRVDKQVAELVYQSAADRASVSATLQTTVRQILVEAGLSVSNSQVLPVRKEGDFDYIGLNLTVTGPLAALDIALAAIGGYSPVLLVESLDVWPNRMRRSVGANAEQTISASLQLLSLRAIR